MTQQVTETPEPRYEELPPTPTGYALMLCHIIRDSSKAADRQWATEQVCQAFRAAAKSHPEKWGKELEPDGDG